MGDRSHGLPVCEAYGGVRQPEARLDVIWLALLLLIGVIIDGIC